MNIMKTIKMKSIQLFSTLMLSLFLIASCNNVKKTDSDAENNMEEIVEVEKDNMDVDGEMTPKNNEVKTVTYKMKAQEPIVYNLDTNGIAGFKDWKDFTVVNFELAEIERANYTTTNQRIRNMNFRVANLSNTIPAWLKTEEVMEDVADVQSEYLELIKESNASENEIKENLEELSEKFDDLKEELNETVAKYVKIHEDAIEEFNEELDDGDIEDAIEEYNEEIKKMNKIVEQK